MSERIFEIPDGGLELFVESDADMTSYFERLSPNLRVGVGGEITAGSGAITEIILGSDSPVL
ncbi:MAG: hypothetical protein F6K30_15240 [Cyanothece sp. SIO2G6]|nr:hypothetical protein [Cyanothece sp. SIO2G6]